MFFPSGRLHHEVDVGDHNELWYKLKYNIATWEPEEWNKN